MLKYCTIFLLLLSACNSNSDEQLPAKEDSVTFLPIPKIESKEIIDTAFQIFWKQFTQVVKTKNPKAFIAIAADSLDCGIENEHGLTALHKFMATSFTKLFDTALVNKLDKKDKLQFFDASIEPEYAPTFLLQQIRSGKTSTKEATIEISDAGDEPIEITLKFIDTNNGYKFYGYDR